MVSAAVAAAAKAEAEIEAVQIDVLDSSTRERSQRRSGSSNSRKSTVKFAVEGQLETLNISEEEENLQKRKLSASLNLLSSNQPSNVLETG